MQQRFLLVALIFFLPVFIFSQTGELQVQNGDKGLYLEHKVMPKEGIFALGRLYNIHPRHIANYNAMDLNKGLAIGQVIRIPLTDTNFTQANSNGVPVYYKVNDKEGLMRVSTVHNKVSLENLRKWNHLSSDNISAGTSLIVGFLVSKEMKMAAPVAVEEKKEIQPVKAEVVSKEKTEPVQIVETPAAEIKKETVKPAEVKQTEPQTLLIAETKAVTGEEGFFKWHFEQQGKQQAASKELTVTSGIFKTTSGWNDGKYYLLMDGVQSGMIIKITNPTNHKSVYAKVLGQMEGINMNKGIDIRISNAAAAKLGVAETDKFIVQVNY